MKRTNSLLRLAALSTVAVIGSNARAANVAFDNSAGTFEWNTPANWLTDALPSNVDNADFRDGTLTGAGPFTITVTGTAGPIQNLRFGAGSSAANLLSKDVTLSGGSITLTGSGSGTSGLNYNANNTAAVVVNSDLVLAGDLDVVINAPASGNNGVTLNGVVSESGGSRTFRKTQNGKLVVTNANNSFTGGVLVQNGTLAVPVLSALGTGTTLTLGNATSAGNIVGNLQYAGLTDVTLNRTIAVQTGGGTGGGLVESSNAGVTLTLAAADAVTGTGRFAFGGNGNVVVNSLVANTTNAVIKTGTGNGRLTNAGNTYDGTTVVRNGTLTVTSAGALGNSSGLTLADGSSSATASPTFLTEGNFTVPQNITVNTIASGTGLSTLGGSAEQVAQSSSFAGSITLGRDLRLTSSTAGANAVAFTGPLSDGAATFGVTKIGSGTVILAGTNDYDGNTAVTEGRLQVNGVQSSAVGSFSVATGATLGGTGSISGSVTVDAGGRLAPGTSIGALTVGSTTLNGDLLIDLDGSGTGTADVLDATALSLGGTASIRFSTLSPLDDATYVFARYASLDTLNFDTVNLVDVPAGYAVVFNYNGLNQLALVAAVPEPASAGLAGLLLLGLGRRRRRGAAEATD